MESLLPYLFSFLLLVPSVRPQACSTVTSTQDAFSYVQPLNTTILGTYGHSPAVYPSPNATGAGGWEEALVKAKAFVAQLTLEEKANMVTGQTGPCVGNIYPIERLGFPGLCLQDGPLSLRVADYVSVFSAGVAAASTWDKTILYERGFALGQEFKAKGAHVALSPVCGPLGRSAYSGRNWEGFAADPYLTGYAMYETIRGHQDAGVQATAKHYIGNEQETQRNPTFVVNGTNTDEMIQDSLSSNIDDRTLHEIYLWPFADAVRVGVASVMCSYQRLNGSHACQNSKAQNGILKGELGFQGYIMSDWGATHSGVASIEAGLDMNMPGGLGIYGLIRGSGSFFGGNVTLAVNNGTIPVSRIDDMIVRIMTPYYFLGQDNYPVLDPSSAYLNTFSPISTYEYDWNITGEANRDVRADHGQLIRRHGAAATILLKNENNALPLKAPKNIAVFGNDASEPTNGLLNQQNYEYGTLYSGGGSGTGRLTYLITPLQAIKARAAQDNALVQFWLNNTLLANSNITDLWIPKEPEVCLVFLKTWAEEALDRTSLTVDWDGNDVVNAVAAACSNTVVVTHSSGINILPFADHPNVTAIIAAHYPGQESGNSLIDVLYGDVNPSGRLPYTIAYNGTDYNAPPTTAVNTTGLYDWQSNFDEKLEIDYRYFDAHNISVRYEFGFGLSYSTFEAADVVASPLVDSITSVPEDLPIVPGGNPALWEKLYNVDVNVTNTGDVAGATVAQLYLAFPPSTPAGTPPRQLRGFEKVYLEPGESATVSFGLLRRDLSYWDTISQNWLIPTGNFGFNVGFSSRDLRASTDVSVTSA